MRSSLQGQTIEINYWAFWPIHNSRLLFFYIYFFHLNDSDPQTNLNIT